MSVLILGLCFAYEPQATVIVLLVFASCFSVGRRVMKTLGIETGGPLEDIAVSAALGLGLLHCALFAIGLAHGYVWPVLVALLAVPLLICIREMRVLYRDLRELDNAWSTTAEASSWAGTLLTVCLAVFGLTATTYALTPSIYSDLLHETWEFDLSPRFAEDFLRPFKGIVIPLDSVIR